MDEPAPARPVSQRAALPRGKQVRIVAVIAVAVGLVIFLVWFGSGLLRPQPEASPPAAITAAGTFRATAAQIADLKIESVTQRLFRSEEVTDGRIAFNADRTVPVVSPYSGRVTRVLHGLGDSVKQGAPLLAIEASEFVQGQADLRNAAEQVSLALLTEKRKRGLYESKGGALQDWQQAQADLFSARNALSSARDRLRILGKTDAEIAAMERAQKIDPSAYVLAPISGAVTDRQVASGQYIQAAASANPVFTIADLSSVWLIANVRESNAERVKIGQLVEVQVLAIAQRTFRARVTYVAAAIDPITHRLPVRAEIENPDGVLKPEMFATFRINTSEASRAPAVPEAAVVYEDDAAHVWVAQGNDILAIREIRTGRRSDGMVEVTSGLRVGERIITSGSLFIDRAAKND